MPDIIDNVDKYKKGWHGGLPETPCGHGSRLSTTKKQREWIPEMIAKYGIKTIADIGAGDLNWIQQTELGDVEYQGFDLVPRHPSVQEFNLLRQIPPKVDMLMCLWVLNHLPYKECEIAIENLKKSGAKYLMMTDRIRYREDQPPEIVMAYVDRMMLNNKGDSIMLIDLGMNT